MSLPPPRRRETSRHYEPGELIAEKYELRRLLGEGGMGSVWLAKNRLLDLPVALKLLRADFNAEEAADRLLREARAAARIGHRAIVRVFDFGHTTQGDPFIVMELLEGQNLAELLEARGSLDPVEAAKMLLPVMDALADAHDAGVVHRDLKPANIFLVSDQRHTQPKIVDFGIAKMSHGASGADRSLTRKGEVVGSPGYMSPEQARGESQIDERTDIWAMCLVLYECVTGGSPFQGDNYNAWLCSIIEDAVRPTVELGAGDDALWALIEHGLRKAPEERWESMRELAAALAGWLAARGIDQDVSGNSLSQYLNEGVAVLAVAAPASSPVSGRVEPGAATVKAPDSSSLRDDSDERGRPSLGLESASALARTKPPEAPGRTSLAIVVLGLLAVTAAVATIAKLSGGSPEHRSVEDATPAAVQPIATPAEQPRRPAATGFSVPSSSRPLTPPAAPAPHVATLANTGMHPAAPSPPRPPTTKVVRHRAAERHGHPPASMPPPGSAPAPSASVAAPANVELKDPY